MWWHVIHTRVEAYNLLIDLGEWPIIILSDLYFDISYYSCPVDPYVFPELDKLRDGDTLEARFNAFKIPESNFLVFEATVRTCRDGCQPAYCPGAAGRQEPSFGRRRRSLNITDVAEIEPNTEPVSERLTDELSEVNSTKVTGTIGDFNKSKGF